MHFQSVLMYLIQGELEALLDYTLLHPVEQQVLGKMHVALSVHQEEYPSLCTPDILELFCSIVHDHLEFWKQRSRNLYRSEMKFASYFGGVTYRRFSYVNMNAFAYKMRNVTLHTNHYNLFITKVNFFSKFGKEQCNLQSSLHNVHLKILFD